MHNMDDPETTAKISDSAYSNSCSNSQSRRSHSSKSTHSGSHSSGSSGYGGKLSTSGSSNILGQPPKKDKDSKKKKLSQPEVQVAETAPVDEPARPQEPDPIFVAPPEEPAVDNVVDSELSNNLPETLIENMDTSPPQVSTVKDEPSLQCPPTNSTENYVTSRPASTNNIDGFSCAISMRDGVVTYTTASLTASLGFPKDIWVGRSFIDFVHPKDHKMFSSLITNGLALPNVTNVMEKKGPTLMSGSTMVCRIRRYRSLNVGFGVKDAVVTYMPFLLKFSFKKFNEDDTNITYLVVHATPFYSAFKVPNEIITKPNPFTIRHDAAGMLDYIDPESVPYLGYLPQDVQDKDVVQLYHAEDLPYLLQVYENIVKEGSVLRSRPYRMMAQNGDFVKLETEWSSVVNPWSMKLEFVIGIHYIVEGPKNPDVFQSPETNSKITDSEQFRIAALRECIVRVMNEVRTKPAEAAKKVIGRRCQELASYMETLVEEPPTTNEELRLDIQDLQNRDNGNYERDSVMLGGISPHHDSDSKSSVETPLSYNQLNYNDNLQRFFESQPHLNLENYQPIPGDVLGQREYFTQSQSYNRENCLSPIAQNSGDTNELSSNASSALPTFENSPGQPAADYQYTKLTEAVLLKHNAEMEKELVKMHRESRSSKEDKEKAFNETRKKKKEHLARCKASFYPTMAGVDVFENVQKVRHGLKRSSKQDVEASPEKHHCPSTRCRQAQHEAATSNNLCANTVTNHRPSNPNMNALMYGVRMPQPISMINSAMPIFPGMPGTSALPALPGTSVIQPIPGTSVMQPMPCTSGTTVISGPSAMPQMQGMPGMSTMSGMTGMYPVYYAPTTGVLTSPTKEQQHSSNAAHQFQAPMPYMMHGHPMYGQQFIYSPMNAQMYPIQHPVMPQISMPYSDSPNPLSLAASNYEQACKSSRLMSTIKPFSNAASREKPRAEMKGTSSAKAHHFSAESINFPKRVPYLSSMQAPQLEKFKNRNSDENAERTDGESSYSSFYSSFFKTDSGSAEESSDHKKKLNSIKNNFWTKNNQIDDALSFQSSTEGTYLKPQPVKKLAYKKVDALWNEQVNLTSELVYRYQMVTKSAAEVLEADKKKIAKMEQPSLVNEQLGQLYLDLQLQGVASRLTLEEGITSSSSSGEETSANPEKTVRKREYNKLIIIHEENAPLPPPESGPLAPEGPAADEDIPCASTSQT